MGLGERFFADPSALNVDVNGQGWLDPHAAAYAVNEGIAKIHVHRLADGYYTRDPLGRAFPGPIQMTPMPNPLDFIRKGDGSGYVINSMTTPLTTPPPPDPILELRKELERMPVNKPESDNPLDYLTDEDREFFRFNGVDPATLRRST